MIILSGAAPPQCCRTSPTILRAPHGLGAHLLVALLVCHAGAALYHQFVRSDELLRRMRYGG
ncbi:cytochrome b/b6 domain-containing protein [Rhizobium mongolense]|uniref:cytochrome b/b6 domain-containing protein n=1 Tax=Rhizobium mongolense TaxID=57676 RepID=UPI0034A434F4